MPLRIGKKGGLVSPKYYIPYTWCRIFDKPKGKEIKTNVAHAKEKLLSTGLTLDKLEKQIAIFSGWDQKYWKSYRKFVLMEDHNGLEKRLKKNGFHEYDENLPDVLNLLETLEEAEGLFELVTLYKLFLALEEANPSDEVVLDVSEAELDYSDFNDIVEDAQRNFVDKVNIYRYLDRYAVDNSDRILYILSRLSNLTEDELIDQVLIPLFSRMGFRGARRITHHGPNELGLDIRPFYETDKFDHRIYYGAQAKASDIHTTSGKLEGNAEGICNQLKVAIDSKFIDEEDNEEKEIDRVMLITSKKVNDLARKVFRKNFPNRQLIILDGTILASYIVQYDLVDNILETRRKPKKAKYES